MADKVTIVVTVDDGEGYATARYLEDNLGELLGDQFQGAEVVSVEQG